jgi:hypothetical protein
MQGCATAVPRTMQNAAFTLPLPPALAVQFVALPMMHKCVPWATPWASGTPHPARLPPDTAALPQYSLGPAPCYVKRWPTTGEAKLLGSF